MAGIPRASSLSLKISYHVTIGERSCLRSNKNRRKTAKRFSTRIYPREDSNLQLPTNHQRIEANFWNAYDPRGLWWVEKACQKVVGSGDMRLNSNEMCALLSGKIILDFSVQIDRGVTHDLFYHFDISTATKIWRDTPKFSKFRPKISSFLRLLGTFGLCHVREVRQRPPWCVTPTKIRHRQRGPWPVTVELKGKVQ